MRFQNQIIISIFYDISMQSNVLELNAKMNNGYTLDWPSEWQTENARTLKKTHLAYKHFVIGKISSMKDKGNK